MLTHSAPPSPFPGRTEIFQNEGGEKKRGERGISEIFIGGGWGIAGDETSNRKQNSRMNLKMFS